MNRIYPLKKLILLSFFLIAGKLISAQEINYSVANAHAHNDYVHPLPFYTAYAAGFGSIEADVFLVDSQLYVAHSSKEIVKDRTLQSLYLVPLQNKIIKNKGHVYEDKQKNLLLLIDLKTKAEPTLHAVIELLKSYPQIIKCNNLKIVITGNQPDSSQLTSYPPWIWFDGNLNKKYSAKQLEKVALFSDNFKNYSSWNGENIPAKENIQKIREAVEKAHSLNKPIRFWGGPDNPNVWQLMMQWKVDYINTDKIEEISDFFWKGK